MRMVIAALVAATPALAQEPPTTIRLSATASTGVTSGSFEAAGDVDVYQIQLSKGLDLAFGVGTDEDPSAARVTLRSPNGARIGRALQAGSEQTVGFEFRTQVAGIYRVELREGGSNPPFPIGYSFGIARDCRAAKTNKCELRPGETKRPFFDSVNDVDWHRLQGLTAGRSYVLTADHGELAVVTGTGTVVASGPSPLTFKAPSSAYARATSDSAVPLTYSLALR